MFTTLRTGFRRILALTAMLAVLAGSFAVPAAAQAETIYAEIGGCRTNVDSYLVQLQMKTPKAREPRSVTIEFSDGTTATASFMNKNLLGTVYYRLDDSVETYRVNEPVAVFATADTSRFGAGWSFSLVSWPCVPTYDVEGSILQHGNQKPVEGLEVCIVDTGACTTTDANGSFSITGVESGTYTLVSDGPVYKPLTTTVTVSGGDINMGELIQYRGGGQD